MLFRSTITVAAALLPAAALGACGDEGSKQQLSSDRAAALRSALDEVEQGIQAGDCAQAAVQASSFRTRVEGLPARVDGDLRQALSASAGRLETLVADQCRPAPVDEPPATPTEEETPQPEGDPDQQDKPKKDKQPKDEKPKQDEPPPDTGGAGEEDPSLDEQGGGAVPPGQD